MTFKAQTTTRLHATPSAREHFNLPAWGWIEEIEIRPRVELANFDASSTYRLEVRLIAPNRTDVPLDVTVVCRDVATAEEMRSL